MSNAKVRARKGFPNREILAYLARYASSAITAGLKKCPETRPVILPINLLLLRADLAVLYRTPQSYGPWDIKVNHMACLRIHL